MSLRISPINWNKVKDPVDLDVWNKLTEQFWLPEKIALSNDLKSWGNFTEEEKSVTMKVFTGLTALDTVQGNVGAISLMADAKTPHEEAVLTNIAFMESVHAKSYSYIFSTLASSEAIEDTFRWAEENDFLAEKMNMILDRYEDVDQLERKIACTLLESFLFYSGFFWPIYLSSRARLTNTADLIRLIIADESVHGYYVGYKYQKAVSALSEEEQERYKSFAFELIQDLYDVEVKYTRDIYDPIGMSDDVIAFLKYNANKALQNLGYESLFPSSSFTVQAAVLSALAPNSGETHDFFSGAGSSYTQLKNEAMDEEDWSF